MHSQFRATFDSPWKTAIPAPRFSFMSHDLSTSYAYNLQERGTIPRTGVRTSLIPKEGLVMWKTACKRGYKCSSVAYWSSRSSIAKALTVRTLPSASSATPVAFATWNQKQLNPLKFQCRVGSESVQYGSSVPVMLTHSSQRGRVSGRTEVMADLSLFNRLPHHLFLSQTGEFAQERADESAGAH